MAGVNVQGFNIGIDASVTISDQYGDLFPAEALGHLIDFDWSSEDTILKVTPITNGGVPIFQTIWNGVTGSMKLARVNGNYQGMISELMDAYHTAGLMVQLGMSVNILNRDGTIDEYLISNMQLHKCQFGNYNAMKEVDMTTQFSASLMTVQGGATPLLTALPTAA